MAGPKKPREPVDVKHMPESIFREMVENVMTAIFIIQEERYVYINPRFTELLGYTQDDLAKIPFYNLVVARDRAWVRERENRRLAGESVPDYYTFWAKHKEGREVCLEVMSRVIIYQDQPAVLGNMLDVTDLRSSEERERRLQRQLIRAEKFASLGQLAAGLAYEINNPLTGIYMAAQLLQHRLTPGMKDERAKVSGIIESAERIQHLLRNYLSLAENTASDYRTTFDINDIVLEARQYYDFQLYHAGIKVQENLASGLPRVEGSPSELKQVLVNLLINAKEAIEAKKQPGGEIIISTAQEDRQVLLTIKDTGEGITKKNLDKVFEPFFTTRTGGQNAGLGLSICQGIIIAHGGAITIASEPGQGTEVTIKLPAIMER